MTEIATLKCRWCDHQAEDWRHLREHVADVHRLEFTQAQRAEYHWCLQTGYFEQCGPRLGGWGE